MSTFLCTRKKGFNLRKVVGDFGLTITNRFPRTRLFS